MKFVVMNKSNPDHINKISEFCSYIKNESSVNEFLEKLKKNQNEHIIYEIVFSTIQNHIHNLGLIYGTKDNRLIELKILNLKDGNHHNNKEFIDEIANYSFHHLDAETVVIHSKQENKTLELLGYESLGGNHGYFSYLKDREKALFVGGHRI